MLTSESLIALDHLRSALLHEPNKKLLIALDRLLSCIQCHFELLDPELPSWQIWIDPASHRRYIYLDNIPHFLQIIALRMPAQSATRLMNVQLDVNVLLHSYPSMSLSQLKDEMGLTLQPNADFMLLHHAKPARSSNVVPIQR